MGQISLDVQLMYWMHLGVRMRRANWNSPIFQRAVELEAEFKEKTNKTAADREEIIQFILEKLIDES